MRNPFPMAKCFNDQRPLINENKCENSMTLFYMLALQNRLNMKRKFKKVMINNSTNINKTYIHLSPQSFSLIQNQGRIQDFKLGGAHLKKFLGVFRVKNHNFTPTNHIFSNCGGRRENCWGISCEKSRFYAKKSYFFPILDDPPLKMTVTLETRVLVCDRHKYVEVLNWAIHDNLISNNNTDMKKKSIFCTDWHRYSHYHKYERHHNTRTVQ